MANNDIVISKSFFVLLFAYFSDVALTKPTRFIDETGSSSSMI